MHRLRLLAACGAVLLAGCAQTGYYWQSLTGHWHIMRTARPLPEWIARPDISPALRERLRLAQRARDFAVHELHLPDNDSYRRYADLRRAAAVWNVVAAPPFSLQLHTWCFPVTGCIGYRGYFNEADAQAEAATLQAQGLEVEVYGVPAYSTLGYSNWLGGDPLLSTFVGWPEGEFVRLMFHELAHQVVYATGDTLFNESFATAVERLGSTLWLEREASPAVRQAFAAHEARRAAFRALTRATRQRLAAIYENSHETKQPAALDRKALAAMKTEAMQDFRAQYATLRATWDAPPALLAGYDRWVAEANNASFAAQAAYNDLVPAFEALYAREGRNWPRFYDAVRALADKPKIERHAALRALLPPPPETTPHG